MSDLNFTTKPDSDAHLNRLLVETDEPWFVSLKQNIQWLFEKQPPLQVTSRPVPIKDIWGEYNYGKFSRPLSVLLHVLLVATLFVARPHADPDERIKIRHGPTIVDVDDYKLRLPTSTTRGGGGGGDRSPLPPSRGVVPKFDLKQLAPPSVVTRNENPELLVVATLIGPPELTLPQPDINRFGDLFGKLGPDSSGPGSHGGIGRGRRGGVGPGDGPGLWEGQDGGISNLVFRAGGGVTAPVPISQVEPEYSEEARKAKYQGTVVIHCVVDTKGAVRNIRLAQSVDLGLDEKAIEAVRQWKFKPGTKDGQPVPVWAAIEVTFRLL